nr:YjcZ family sporulation protein [Alkalihalobacillus sp. CinArs1]
MSEKCDVQGAYRGGAGKGFALIVVLFILLIIVGAAALGGAYGCNNVAPAYGKGCGYGGGYGY